jgi:hypothetical protein
VVDSGSDTDVPPGDEGPDAPDAPDTPDIEAPEFEQVEPLLSGEAEAEALALDDELAVSYAVSLELGRVLAATDNGLVAFDESKAEPHYYGFEAGVIHSIAVMSPDTALVFGEGGIFVAGFGELVRSPLDDWVQGANASAKQPGDGARLWFSTPDALFMWHNDTLEQIELSDTEPLSMPPILAATQEPPTLWLAQGESLVAVLWEQDTAVAHSELIEIEIDGMAVTDANHLWVLSEGALMHRKPQGEWSQHKLPVYLEAISAHADYGALWLQGGESLYRYGNELVEIKGVPTVWSLSAVNDDRFLLYGPQLLRVVSGAVEIPKIQWSEHLSNAVFENRCTPCHKQGTLYPLFRPICWHSPKEDPECNYDPSGDENCKDDVCNRWDRILKYVKSGFMPPNPNSPLDNQEIQLLTWWAQGGFLE